jgi:alpha/beta superfamily hydrolase
MPEIMISGPAGRLEARYHPPKVAGAPMALVLHPHPNPEGEIAHRGTMNNKVTYALFHTLAKAGYATLRFNFRGVGKSQGAYDKGEGELADAAAAMDWLQSQNTEAQYAVVAGFSFGSWIAMQLLMRRPEIYRFIAVAPPANKYDFTFLAPCPSSGMMLLGDQDDLVTESSVRQLATKLSRQKGIKVDYRLLSGVDHYFTNRLDDLVYNVSDYLETIG